MLLQRDISSSHCSIAGRLIDRAYPAFQVHGLNTSRDRTMAMELSDEITIQSPRAVVYAALNDIAILQKCIPGCEALERVSEDDLTARVVLKIGPVKATFAGKVKLDRSQAPDIMSLQGEGNGGVAGFARGGAKVTLEDLGDFTILHYDATADVGGKIAQLGNRLMIGTAKKLAAEFFTNFAQALGAPEAEGAEAGDEEEA
jgi:uncharacterized protein